MRLFNPPANLGGRVIEEDILDEPIKPGTKFSVTEEMDKKLLKKYKFLKRIDVPEYSPSYHETTKKKTLCHIIQSKLTAMLSGMRQRLRH